MSEESFIDDLFSYYVLKLKKRNLLQDSSITHIDFKLRKFSVKQIKDYLDLSRYYQIVISGIAGSGKTTTAYYIASQLADFVNNNAEIIMFSSLSINAQFIQKIESIQSQKEYLVIIFDDTTHALNALKKQEQSLFNNLLARIRHSFNAKVLLIVITHITGGINPLLRNAHLWIYQSINTEDLNHIYKHNRMLINKAMNKVRQYIDLQKKLNSNFIYQIPNSSKQIKITKNERVVVVYDYNDFSIYLIPFTPKPSLQTL